MYFPSSRGSNSEGHHPTTHRPTQWPSPKSPLLKATRFQVRSWPFLFFYRTSLWLLMQFPLQHHHKSVWHRSRRVSSGRARSAVLFFGEGAELASVVAHVTRMLICMFLVCMRLEDCQDFVSLRRSRSFLPAAVSFLYPESTQDTQNASCGSWRRWFNCCHEVTGPQCKRLKIHETTKLDKGGHSKDSKTNVLYLLDPPTFCRSDTQTLEWRNGGPLLLSLQSGSSHLVVFLACGVDSLDSAKYL